MWRNTRHPTKTEVKRQAQKRKRKSRVEMWQPGFSRILTVLSQQKWAVGMDQPYRHGDPHPWRNLQLLEEGHHTKLKGRLEHHCAWGRSPSHGGSTDSRCWDAAKQETVIKDEQACFGADTMMGAHAMYSKGCSKRLKQCGGFEGK